MTDVFQALLKQQQEQAKRDQTSMQSIASALTEAVQCFQRCAAAAERHAHACEFMAASGSQGSNIMQARFQIPLSSSVKYESDALGCTQLTHDAEQVLLQDAEYVKNVKNEDLKN